MSATRQTLVDEALRRGLVAPGDVATMADKSQADAEPDPRAGQRMNSSTPNGGNDRDRQITEAIARGLIEEDPQAAELRKRGVLNGMTPAEAEGHKARGDEPADASSIESGLSQAGQTVQNIGRVYPVAEAAANLASQAYAVPAGGLAGLGAMATRALGMDEAAAAGNPIAKALTPEPADAVVNVSNALTVKPMTRHGAEMTATAAYPFEKLGEAGNAIGERTAEATSSPAVGAMANAVSQLAIGDLAVRGPHAAIERAASMRRNPDATATAPDAEAAAPQPINPQATSAPVPEAATAPSGLTLSGWAEKEGERIGGVSHLRGIVESLIKVYAVHGPEKGRAVLDDMASNTRGDTGFHDEVAVPGFIDELHQELVGSAEAYKAAAEVQRQSRPAPASSPEPAIDHAGEAVRRGLMTERQAETVRAGGTVSPDELPKSPNEASVRSKIDRLDDALNEIKAQQDTARELAMRRQAAAARIEMTPQYGMVDTLPALGLDSLPERPALGTSNALPRVRSTEEIVARPGTPDGPRPIVNDLALINPEPSLRPVDVDGSHNVVALAVEPKGRQWIVRGRAIEVDDAVRSVDPTLRGVPMKEGMLYPRAAESQIRAAVERVNSERVAMHPGATYAGLIDDMVPRPLRQPTTTGIMGKLFPKSDIKPIRREDILRPFLKALDARLYEGRVKGESVLGFYLPGKQAVRVKKKADLEVTAHELAHFIDDRLLNGFGRNKGQPNTRPWLKGPNHKEYAEELRGLSYDHTKVYEGFAEFVRHWMTNPEVAKAKAPAFTKWFETWLKTQPIGDAILEAQRGMTSWYAQGNLNKLASKIGEPKPVNADLDTLFDEARQGIFDDLHGVYRMERQLLGDIKAGGPYETARLTRGAHAVVEGAMTLGMPKVMADGSTKFVGKSLKDILKPVAGELDSFGLYAVARSARELFLQGRERLFTKGEIKAGLDLETPAFKEAFAQYQIWNRAIVDFAETKGLINPETRKLWRRTEYLPFYRAGQPGATGTAGMPGFFGGVKQLKGGTGNLKSVLGNMIQNASSLITEALKNEARVEIANLADKVHGGGKFMVRIGTENAAVNISKSQVRDFVAKMLGVSRSDLQGGGGLSTVPPELQVAVDKLTNEFMEQPDYLKFWMFKQSPKGDNLVAVMREGKPTFYEVADPILFRSMQALSRPARHWVVNFLNTFRMVGQTAVTLTPDFIFKNIARDTAMGAIMTRAGFRPVMDSLKGMKSRITKDKNYREFVANGGGFSSLLANEEAFTTHLERFYTQRGISYKTVLDTPSKLLHFIEEVANAFEMSTRLGEFGRARDRGETPQHSAYLAREVSTDFAMRGDSQVMGFFYDSVPFLKAAANSMDRLYRGLAHDENRAHIAAKTGLLAMASMGLYSINRGNPLYEQLEDWDRDTSWHFFLPKAAVPDNAPPAERYTHYRFPKLWEIGAVSSLAERTLEHAMDNDIDGFGKETAHLVAHTFGVDFVPQAFSPLLEQAMNRNRFTDRPIETEGMQDLQPWARSAPYTSRTLAALGEKTRDLPESLQVNPVRTEALLRGYFKTWAAYGLSLVDGALFDDRPAMRLDEYPVIKSFYAQEPAKHTKYATEFYDLLHEATAVRRTMRKMDQTGRTEIADELERAPANARYRQLTRANKALQGIHADMRAVYDDHRMLPDQKRRRLDDLTTEANALLKSIVDEVKP